MLALKPEDHLQTAAAEAAFISGCVPEVRRRSQTLSVQSGLDLIRIVGHKCVGRRGDGVMFDLPQTWAVDPGPPRRSCDECSWVSLANVLFSSVFKF